MSFGAKGNQNTGPAGNIPDMQTLQAYLDSLRGLRPPIPYAPAEADRSARQNIPYDPEQMDIAHPWRPPKQATDLGTQNFWEQSLLQTQMPEGDVESEDIRTPKFQTPGTRDVMPSTDEPVQLPPPFKPSPPALQFQRHLPLDLGYAQAQFQRLRPAELNFLQQIIES